MRRPTTLNEYRKYIEKDAALERRFQSVKVEAPSIDEAILILKGLRHKYEAHHKVEFTDKAVEALSNCPTVTSPTGFCRTRRLT